MAKIKGDAETIKRIMEAKPGDSRMYVNREALDQLPPEYDALAIKVEFDPDKDFTNIGTETKPNYYPTTKLMYTIAERRGISGVGDTDPKEIYEEVDINEMNMIDTPQIIKMKVGYKVIKQGAVLQEDGSMRYSGPRIGIFNAWDEAIKYWWDEEKWTEGYTKPNKYPNKYHKKWLRRAHFRSLLDVAVGQADTKAWLKVIRELAGLKTGYTEEDLKEHAFYFTKIVRSENAIKLESAARLDAIRNGRAIPQATGRLYAISAPAEEVPIIPENIEDVQETEQPPQESEQPPIKPTREQEPREQILSAMCYYIDNKLVPDKEKDAANSLLNWVKTTPKCADDPKWWPKALACLARIQKGLKAEQIYQHSLTLPEV